MQDYSGDSHELPYGKSQLLLQILVREGYFVSHMPVRYCKRNKSIIMGLFIKTQLFLKRITLLHIHRESIDEMEREKV